MEVSKFADVISGYAFRTSLEMSEEGDAFVLQGKNLRHGKDVLNTNGLVRISDKPPRSSAYLKENDVMLVSRGIGPGTYKSAVFKCSDQNVIASSSVHIIRILNEDVLPEYVSFYLNSSEGQNMLAELFVGSGIQTLARKHLQDMEIPIPPLLEQKMLVELCRNIKRQEDIQNLQLQIKNNIVDQVFRNLSAHV